MVPDGDGVTLGEGGTDGVADDDGVTEGVVYSDTVGDRDAGTVGLAVGVALRPSNGQQAKATSTNKQQPRSSSS